jgi:hypothetical protein
VAVAGDGGSGRGSGGDDDGEWWRRWRKGQLSKKRYGKD